MKRNLIALAVAAGLSASVGQALSGQASIGVVNSINTPRLSPPATRLASKTHSAAVSQFGYESGPGWTCAHVKRMAQKRKNVARNKSSHRARAA